MKGDQVKRLTVKELHQLPMAEELILAMECNLLMIKPLREQIKILEKVVLSKAELKPDFERLKTIDGIGKMLSLTIMLETGEVNRFPAVGDYVSYCRCVSSNRFSNGKKKGKGNSKNGNKFLNWAFVEGATCAIQYNEKANRFYQRKKNKTNSVIAKKALAHKLARASYFRLFGNSRGFRITLISLINHTK